MRLRHSIQRGRDAPRVLVKRNANDSETGFQELSAIRRLRYPRCSLTLRRDWRGGIRANDERIWQATQQSLSLRYRGVVVRLVPSSQRYHLIRPFEMRPAEGHLQDPWSGSPPRRFQPCISFVSMLSGNEQRRCWLVRGSFLRASRETESLGARMRAARQTFASTHVAPLQAVKTWELFMATAGRSALVAAPTAIPKD